MRFILIQNLRNRNAAVLHPDLRSAFNHDLIADIYKISLFSKFGIPIWGKPDYNIAGFRLFLYHIKRNARHFFQKHLQHICSLYGLFSPGHNPCRIRKFKIPFPSVPFPQAGNNVWNRVLARIRISSVHIQNDVPF